MNVERVGAELGQYVRASANRVARQVGFTYTGCDAPLCPQTLAQLRVEHAECLRTGQSFRVSRDRCENTIYGSKDANMAFRFWHDMVHVFYGLETTLVDELRAGLIHVEDCKRDGYSKDHQDLMWIDTCGQSLYCYIVGAFPEDQMAFAKEVADFSIHGPYNKSDLTSAVRHIAKRGYL